jgi:hypothetical protein
MRELRFLGQHEPCWKGNREAIAGPNSSTGTSLIEKLDLPAVSWIEHNLV